MFQNGTYLIFNQFAAFKDIFEMFGNSRPLDTKQKGYFVLRQPHIFVPQKYFHPHLTVWRSIEKKLCETIVLDISIPFHGCLLHRIIQSPSRLQILLLSPRRFKPKIHRKTIFSLFLGVLSIFRTRHGFQSHFIKINILCRFGFFVGYKFFVGNFLHQLM
jgi:hypothetical protein